MVLEKLRTSNILTNAKNLKRLDVHGSQLETFQKLTYSETKLEYLL